MMKTLLSGAAAAALFGSAAMASTVVQTQVFVFPDTLTEPVDASDLTDTNFDETFDVQQFDGDLTSVHITLQGFVGGSVQAESQDQEQSVVTLNLQATISAAFGGADLVDVIPLAQEIQNLDAFDGTTDFEGPSGFTSEPLFAEQTETLDITDDATLALFEGDGTLAALVDAVAQSSGTGAGNLITSFDTDAGFILTVEYKVESRIPVPAALPLLATGLAGLGFLGWRRTRA
ncbi:MAG: choice-of-anchor E domain-containing protein [Paracoccaceae bacterium]